MQTFSHRSPLDFLTLLQAKQTHRHRIMSSLGVMIDRNQIVHLIRVANPTDSPQSMMNSHACYHKSHQLLGVAKICSIKTKQDKWGLRRRYRYQEMWWQAHSQSEDLSSQFSLNQWQLCARSDKSLLPQGSIDLDPCMMEWAPTQVQLDCWALWLTKDLRSMVRHAQIETWVDPSSVRIAWT